MLKIPFAAMLAAAGVCSISHGSAADSAPPDRPGKDTVAEVCAACHTLDRLRAGQTPAGWRTVVRVMLNFGVPIPADQVATLTDYLAAAFPERPRPAAVLVSGPAQVTIKQWPVPTPGSRPHDPLGTMDGAIRYAGQLANVLGPSIRRPAGSRNTRSIRKPARAG